MNNGSDRGIILPQSVQVGFEWSETIGDIPPLVGAQALALPGNRVILMGGMTVRLAVAASIMGPIVATGRATEQAAQDALTAADALIESEKAQRG